YLDLATLQTLLGVEAQRAGERAVVRGNVLCAESLGKGEGNALNEATRVDEDERGAVRLRVRGELVEDLLPHLCGEDGAELIAGHLDREVKLAALANLHDRCRLALWM